MAYLMFGILLLAFVGLAILAASKLGAAIDRERDARRRANALWEIQETPMSDGTLLVELVRYGERHTRPVGEIPVGADDMLVHEVRSRAEWEQAAMNERLLTQRKLGR